MEKNKKYISISILMGGLLLIILALGVKSWQNRYKAIRMIYITKVIDKADFWSSLIEGAQMAAKDHEVQLSVVGPDTEGDFEAQNRLIEQAIVERPDVILLSPCSYSETVETAKKIEQAGIKLVLVDSAMEQTLGSAMVATDNFEAGKKLGDLLVENLPRKAVVGVVAHVQGSSTAMERENGLQESLKNCGREMEILPTVFCNSDYDKAYEVTKQMLTDHPEVNAIAGLNEYSAVGAARAVKDLGAEERIVMVGFDNSIEEIQLLEAGIFEGIVIQKPFNMGYLGVEKALEVLHNSTAEPMVDSGSEVITKQNMYTIENQKLLFPFLTK